MTTKLLVANPAQSEQESELPETGLLEAVVGDYVMSALGRPTGLYRVQVRHVWGGSYRVNVFVGLDAVSFKVAHSYFLKADTNGKILTCCPALARAY